MRAAQLLVVLLFVLVALSFAGELATERCCVRMSAVLRTALLPGVGGLRSFTALTGKNRGACAGNVCPCIGASPTTFIMTIAPVIHNAHSAARRHAAQPLERTAAMSAAAAATGDTGVSIAFVTVPDKVCGESLTLLITSASSSQPKCRIGLAQPLGHVWLRTYICIGLGCLQQDVGHKIARHLVENKLAACVSIIPGLNRIDRCCMREASCACMTAAAIATTWLAI